MQDHPISRRKWLIPALVTLSLLAGWTASETQSAVTETLGAFTPHGFCLAWEPGLLWVHAGSNLLIALSYFVIPGAILFFVHNKPEIQDKSLFWLFALFIVACGLTHVMGAVVLWKPHYYLQSAIMVITTVVSLLTAVILWPKIPYLLASPTAESSLIEIEKRQQAQAELELAKTQTEAALLANNQFLANMSYELRTPMKAVLAMLYSARPA